MQEFFTLLWLASYAAAVVLAVLWVVFAAREKPTRPLNISLAAIGVVSSVFLILADTPGQFASFGLPAFVQSLHNVFVNLLFFSGIIALMLIATLIVSALEKQPMKRFAIALGVTAAAAVVMLIAAEMTTPVTMFG